MAENPNAMAGYPYDGCGPDPTPDERAEALRHHVHLCSWPPYVGGDDDGIEAWFGECCACGWKGERRKRQSLAYGDMLKHMDEALLAAESERAELAREVEARRAAASGLETALEQSLDREESLAREAEELRGALWETDSALELMTNYLDDLLDRAKAVNEMKERHPNANAGAYALYAQGRLTELVAKLAALSEPTEGE